MKPVFRAIHRHDSGFTLVELLIVIALLAVLSAIVIPSVTNLVGYGQSQGAAAEKSIVQTAMDVMMARQGLSSVNVTAATSNMASFPTGSALYPTYLRVATTKGTYACDATGLVSQNSTGY